jgi:Cof subfamily protein (haloacid dehalogenase superfamily)
MTASGAGARQLPAIALLISDVDGTLVRPDKSLSDANVAAVAALRDAGVAFSLVSSRPPRGMASVLQALQVSLPYAAFNGGVVLHADGTAAVTHRIPADAAREAVDVLTAHGVDAWVFADDLWLVLKDSGRLVDKEAMTLGYGPTRVDDFTPYLDRVDKMVGASDDHALLAQLEQTLAARLAERATAVRSQPYYLDLTAPQANKGNAVVALAELIGVDLSHVAVIGDADNDVPMFGKAGWAMAMGQGEARVQAQADVVTASNSDDGVAVAIHRYVLGAAARPDPQPGTVPDKPIGPTPA